MKYADESPKDLPGLPDIQGEMKLYFLPDGQFIRLIISESDYFFTKSQHSLPSLIFSNPGIKKPVKNSTGTVKIITWIGRIRSNLCEIFMKKRDSLNPFIKIIYRIIFVWRMNCI